MAASLASGVLLARWLGPTERGLLAAVLYWPHFIAGMTSFGVNEGTAIQLARRGDSDSIVATTIALSVVLALVVGLLTVSFIGPLLGAGRASVATFTQLYLLAFLPATFLTNNLLAIPQGRQDIAEFNRMRFVQPLAYPAVLAAFWWAGVLTTRHAALAVLAGALAAVLVQLWRRRRGLRAPPKLREALDLMKLSLPLHGTNIVMALAQQFDTMALIVLASNAELGQYVVAYAAAGAACGILTQTYVNIMLPAAAKLGLSGDRGGNAAVLRSLRRILGMIALATVAMIVLLPLLLPLVYGASYREAVLYAQILVVALGLANCRKVMVYLLRSWGINMPAVLGEACVAAIILIGSYPVVTRYHVTGLCALLVVAQIVGTGFVARRFFLISGGHGRVHA